MMDERKTRVIHKPTTNNIVNIKWNQQEQGINKDYLKKQ